MKAHCETTPYQLSGQTRGAVTEKTSEIIEFLCGLDGVKNAFILNNRQFEIVCREENGIVASGGIDYRNIALEECYTRDAIFCLFCDGMVQEQESISMTLEDDFGTVCGHDVPPCMIKRFEKKENIFWLSECFVVYTGLNQKSEAKILLHPQKFKAMENREDVRNPKFFYPALTTDMKLKEMFRMEPGNGLSTVILGLDFSYE
jgi:hypothetical protein